MRFLIVLFVFFFISANLIGKDLEKSFKNPPDSVKPWVFWFWINGNISQDGITKELEAMKVVSGSEWLLLGIARKD